MRVLLLSSPSGSHLLPMIPVAWALRAAGHEVLVVGRPNVADTATRAGLSVKTIGDEFDGNAIWAELLPPGQRPIEAFGRGGEDSGGEATRAWSFLADQVVDEQIEFARGWAPDLIVADPFELSALLVGGVLGVPVVQHRWGVDVMGASALVSGRRFLAGTCARLGLDALPDPALVIDPCPPSLQTEAAAGGKAIRYVPFNGAARDVDIWPEHTSGPKVIATFGWHALALNSHRLLRSVLDAAAGLPAVTFAMTLGEKYREELGEIPANVVLIDPTPLHLVVGDCAAVVHQGGSGTGLTALAHAVPQVVLPGYMEEFDYGDVLAEAGAGVTLDTAEGQNDPETVRAALVKVLEDDGYREQARQLRAEIERTPAPAAVVAELEALAAR
ncbi:nucleotide disphospho-sugar-binding domain-containing protein [Amycolatopsis sp. cg13]|uniref:nucleotide disphospho-sugar-binding domain-containing protein n=1 Tax=Amycolatopsis sp. cg13 TaxID=3238807 RepID=UPI0035249B93